MFGLLPVFDNSAAAASSAAHQAQMQQQQRALHAVQSLPLTTGMNMQQPQQQPAWLPYQLPPLPPQQQQQQQQLQAADIITVKTLPLGMRVGGMSPQQRLQLRTDLLNGRQERMQQLQQQQQQQGAAAAAVGEGEPAAKQPKTRLYGPAAAAAAAAPNAAGNAQLAADYQARVNREVQQLMRSRLVGEDEPAAKQAKTGMQNRHGQAIYAAQYQQQQQQQLSVHQVQMLQASLRQRQQEMAQQQLQQQQQLSASQVQVLQASLRLQQQVMAPQQQHASAPCIGLLAAAAAAAAAGRGTPQHEAMLDLPHAFGSSAAAAGSSDDNQTRVHRQMQELQHSRAAAATSARIQVSVPSLPGQAVLHDVALQQHQKQCSDNAMLERMLAEPALSAAFLAFRRSGSSAAPGSSAELEQMRADPALTAAVQAFVRNDDRAQREVEAIRNYLRCYSPGAPAGSPAGNGSHQALLLPTTAGTMQAALPLHAAAAAVEGTAVHPAALMPAEQAAAAAEGADVLPAAGLPLIAPAAAAAAPNAAGCAPLARAVLSAAAQQVLDIDAELLDIECELCEMCGVGVQTALDGIIAGAELLQQNGVNGWLE
jgi:hypothetical protein